MSFVELPVPVTGDRFLKMFWTSQRTSPTRTLWEFTTDWECARAFEFLTSRFKFRDEIQVERIGNKILMGIREVGGVQ